MRAGLSNLEKAMEYVSPEPNSGCWLWTGGLSMPDGYGLVHVRLQERTPAGKAMFKRRHAHRVIYEEIIGPVPNGMELDHLCRVRCCVNPHHLEPVTHAENVKRGDSGKYLLERTACPQGHEYTPENTYRDKKRHCRMCIRCMRDRKRKIRANGGR